MKLIHHRINGLELIEQKDLELSNSGVVYNEEDEEVNK